MYNAYQHNDTIIAPVTPPGRGAIGVLRLSGEKAIDIVNRYFKGKDLSRVDSHTVHFGKIIDRGQLIDEVLVSVFIAPRSYTGENVVEISCHGSDYILNRMMALMVSGGARVAKPGEFTLRAFLNRKLDLAQAEAVADLIAAGSEQAHRQAIQQLKGGLSARINALRQQLVHFASLIELELDFSEEDVEFADRQQLLTLLEQIVKTIHNLAGSFRLGNAVKTGVPVVIAGKPNAGKSTLLNALLEDERAIVSDIPGTTRDAIEATLNIEGILFRLIDTAGIREAKDAIEAIGVERTFEYIRKAAYILYVFNLADTTPDSLRKELENLPRKDLPVILAGNKMDLLSSPPDESYKQFGDFIAISSREGLHLDMLKQHLFQKVTTGAYELEDTLVTNIRHVEALERCAAVLQRVKTGITEGIGGELIAAELREALFYMGLITGEVVTDDLLDNIFKNFCIGK